MTARLGRDGAWDVGRRRAVGSSGRASLNLMAPTHPATFFPASTRGFWCYPYADPSIVNTGGGDPQVDQHQERFLDQAIPEDGHRTLVTQDLGRWQWSSTRNHYGWIKVWASGATNNPQKVNVTMFRY
jgi:hypothetical protein